MRRLSEKKVILVYRDTRLDELIRRHNTRDQAKFFVESRGDDFDIYEEEDRVLKAALSSIKAVVKETGRLQPLERELLPNFLFGPEDVVVVAGQDGLVANTLKYLDGQPLLAVNPAPDFFDGPLLQFELDEIREALEGVVSDRFKTRSVSMARAMLNDGQTLLAVNDVYIGPRLPTSLRYEIECSGRSEVQSSSGVLVSTGLGSTGWLRSVLTGAGAIAGRAPDGGLLENGLPWDCEQLVFSVREPFPSRTTETGLVFGQIQTGERLRVTSRTAEGGIVFSDGIVNDAIEFASGSILEVTVAECRGVLVSV